MISRPTPSTLGDDSQLLGFLSGVYERLLELGRGDRSSTQTLTFATATDTKVFHGLGRPIGEWAVLDKNADANIWQSTSANTNPSLYVILQASAAVTAKLRFA